MRASSEAGSEMGVRMGRATLAACSAMFVLLLGCGGERGAAQPQTQPAASSTLTTTGHATPVTTANAPPSVRIAAVGDIMLARDLVTLMDEHGSGYPYAKVTSLLSDADITIGNMEGTFTDRGAAANKFYTFRTPPRHARGLATAGFDIVSLGNNHTMDFGPAGLQDTLAALDAVGVRHAGAGMSEAEARAPAVLEANGLRVAFISANGVEEASFARGDSAGVARASAGSLAADVAAARLVADFVVVAIHAGSEYTDEPTSLQRELAHAAIDAGAVLVLGHHPHALQGLERYGEGWIAYSLGNFVFDLDHDDLATLGRRPFDTVVLSVVLSPGQPPVVSYEPVAIDPVENRPVRATPSMAQAIGARLDELSAALR